MSNRKPKNIICIVLDQLNYRCLGYQGHPDVKTPNLDLLRGESVDFTHCHSQSPICHPSRVSLFTGQYQRTHHQYGFEGMLPRDRPCWPKYFHENGYITGAAGKLHLNSMGPDLGFDYAAPTLAEDEQAATEPSLWYPRYLSDAGYRWPSSQCHGKSGLNCLPDDGIQRSTGKENYLACAGRCSVPWEHSNEYWTTERGLDFLKQAANSKQPHFLWLSYDRPHAPHGVSEPYYALYDPAKLEVLASETREELLNLPIDYLRTNMAWAFSEADFRRVLSCYYALITAIDAEIGRIVEYLKASSTYDDTMIVFTSDHGDMAGMHRTFEKSRMSEQVLRVPLLIKPAMGQFSVCSTIQEPIELIDLFPTVCGLNGLADPGGLDGRDLADAIDQGELNADHVTFSEQYSIKAVIDSGWKLVYYLEQARGMLFDLKEDPTERSNLYRSQSHAEKRLKLKSALIAKLAPSCEPVDSCEIDHYILNHGERFEKFQPGALGWDNAPFHVVAGRGLYCIRDSVTNCMLYYRLDGASHELYDLGQEDLLKSQTNLLGESAYCQRFEALVDGLIDWLIRSIAPLDVFAFQATKEAAQYPSEAEVDDYLENYLSE